MYPFVIIAILLVNTAAAKSYDVVTLGLAETVIHINGKFLGKEIFAFGSQKLSGDIVIVLEGEPGVMQVKQLQQGKLGMWMVGETYRFDNVPSLYIMDSTIDTEQLAHGKAADGYLGINNLPILCDNIDLSQLFLYDMINAKQALIENQFKLGFFSQNRAIFRAANNTLFYSKIFLPANLKEGSYTISAYLLKDGKILGHHTIPIKAIKTGLSGFLSNLNNKHSTTYATLAITTSMLLGIIGYYLISILSKTYRLSK